MDGFQACETLRHMGCTIPIIGVTGNAMDHQRAQFLECGAIEVVPKPINKQILSELVGRYCCSFNLQASSGNKLNSLFTALSSPLTVSDVNGQGSEHYSISSASCNNQECYELEEVPSLCERVTQTDLEILLLDASNNCTSECADTPS